MNLDERTYDWKNKFPNATSNLKKFDMVVTFTKNGIVPDFIINPISFPKRKTIGQLIELVMGKTGSLTGQAMDGTPFTRMNPSDIGDVLEKVCGFQRNGLEILYDGKTGEQIQSAIFIGPNYYHRLKHMVQDKVHCLGMDFHLRQHPNSFRWSRVTDLACLDSPHAGSIER